MDPGGRPKTLAALLATLVLAVELVLALYNPRWNNPDELSHMQYVLFLRDHARLPDPYREDVKIQQDKHPPLAYAVAAAALRASDGLFDAARGGEVRALPGPYDVRIRPHRWMEDVRLFEGQLYLVRALFALFATGTALYLLAAARLVLPGQPRLAWALAGSLALIPQVALSGASLTPDTPLTFFSAGAWFHLLRPAVRPEGGRASDPWLAGLLIGLALLSKSAAVFLLPVAVLLAVFPRRQPGHLVRLLIPLGLGLVVAGWWYARNVALTGDPFQARAQFETFAVMARHSPIGGPEWEALVQGVADSFFGFWHREIRIAAPLLLAFHMVAGAVAVGLLMLLDAGTRVVLSEPLRRALPAALLGAGGLALLLVLGYLRFPSPQGRYLYPALGPLLTLVAAGLVALFLHRNDAGFWLALPPVMALLTLVSFFEVVVARESVERSRARGEGGVVFYEDCGLPGGHPHRVQGFDLPDQSQLGRRSAWRTLDVHAEAVVYTFDLAGMAPSGLQVRVLYHDPNPALPALADVDGRLSYSAQRLWAGAVLVHDAIDLTATPREFAWPLPESAIEGGRLTLRFEKVRGNVAAVAELWIEQRWISLARGKGGPALAAVNRTGRELRALCFYRATRDGKAVAEGVAELSVPNGPGGTAGVEIAGVRGGDGSSVIEAAVVPLASPFASWQAEALPAFSGRVFGDPGADGGFRLTGPAGAGRLFELAVPETASGPGCFEILCRESALVADERLRLGPGDRGPEGLSLEVVAGATEERVEQERGFRRWSGVRTKSGPAPGGATLRVSVPRPPPLADVDRVELLAAPGLLERVPPRDP